jgi:hypothetical protein
VELADQLGNLLSRCSGKALNPDRCIPKIDASLVSDEDKAFCDKVDALTGTYYRIK